MLIRDKNILVTGGAGFIGSHLCESLIKRRPGKLVVVDNLFLGKEENLNDARKAFPNLKFYRESIMNISKIKKIISENKIDVIFNLAVIPLPASLQKPGLNFRVNANGTLNLCELCRKGFFKTLIHCSTSEVYGTAQYLPMDEKHPFIPSTPYAASKVAADQLCLSYAKVFGIDLSIVRPFNNYGPRQNDQSYAGIIPIVINNVLQRKNVEIFGDGKQTRDFIFVKDTAEAMVRICEEEKTRNEVINIAGGEEISVNQLVRMILTTMKAKDIRVVFKKPRPGDVRRHCAGVKKAKQLIGFQSKVSFEKGLKATINWYQNKG